jgi:hypothetical protein
MGAESKVKVTPAMIEAGVEALLSSFSDEYLSWRAPGLESAVEKVFRVMLASSAPKLGRDGLHPVPKTPS